MLNRTSKPVTGSLMQTDLKTSVFEWVLSALIACTIAIIMLTLTGCSLTLGPVVKVESIIVEAGTPLEILDNVEVKGRWMTANATDGKYSEVRQQIGGWYVMPKAHWKSVKGEIERLRIKCGEPVESPIKLIDTPSKEIRLP